MAIHAKHPLFRSSGLAAGLSTNTNLTLQTADSSSGACLQTVRFGRQ